MTSVPWHLARERTVMSELSRSARRAAAEALLLLTAAGHSAPQWVGRTTTVPERAAVSRLEVVCRRVALAVVFAG